MKTLRLDGLLKIVIVLAIASLGASVFVLLDPWHWIGATAERVGISQALSTALALLLGTIAIIVAVTVERTEYRAQEALRSDVVELAATLHSVLTKTAAWYARRGQTGTQPPAPDFEAERYAIGRFLCSPTGFAFLCRAAEKSDEAGRRNAPEVWRGFSLVLADLQMLQGAALARFVYEARDAFFEMVDLIGHLSAHDLRQIRRFLEDFEHAMPFYRQAMAESVLVRAFRNLH